MPNFKLIRVAVGPGGAFGVLLHNGIPFAVTLERVFEEKGQASPIIPPGTYTCRRTTFLRGGYPTYEIGGILGHSRLLFHVGNRETDSEGCVLVADSFQEGWVSGSRVGFAKFMDRAAGRAEFALEITSP